MLRKKAPLSILRKSALLVYLTGGNWDWLRRNMTKTCLPRINLVKQTTCQKMDIL